MTLDLGVLLLVLAAAVMHAGWNVVVKAGADRVVVTTLVMAVQAPPCALALIFLPALQPEAWPYVLLSAAVHWLYYAALIGAYRHGDLSQVYPIARGAAPLLVALEAWALAGESLSPVEWLGLLILSAGIMSLALRRRGIWLAGELQALGFALLTAATIAVYLIVDALGGRASGNALTYICWLFVLEGVPFLLLTFWLRRGRIVAAFRPNLVRGGLGGVIAGLSYGITIWAMSVAPVAHVVAVRETNVLFGAAFGALLLKEPFGRFRIGAAAVVVTGAVLLNVNVEV